MAVNHLLHILFRQLIVFSFLVNGLYTHVNSQPLSNINLTSDSPLYTVYAAPPERTSYQFDQGYSLSWLDPEKPVGFESKDGGGFGLYFKADSLIRGKLGTCYEEPVISINYPDLVKFFYYPLKGLRVEVFFVVYSSVSCVAEIRLFNENGCPLKLEIIHSLDPGNMAPGGTDVLEEGAIVSYPYLKKKDPWMVEHQIPFRENLRSVWLCAAENVRNEGYKQIIPAVIPANSSYQYRLIRVIGGEEEKTTALARQAKELFSLDLRELVKADEQLFSGLTSHSFDNKETTLLFYSCYSLMRQCLMGAEGKCRQNYYVFSREPKWGWGYGGQVFHESLCMIAYARLDPAAAMNSQRIFMDRQRENGYINYRTGPYLDETIETNNQLTSSAPWFNYENGEIFRITGDRKFLEEAYRSGEKFYNYYTANRDTDKDGLYEWGSDAVLESVRDARVAVWDEVCDPAMVEGPDLNSMLVKEARSLASMAEELGLEPDAKNWNEKADNIKNLMNRYMWDSLTGFYYNINKTDHSFTIKKTNDLKRKEIIGFLPLWAGVCTAAQAGSLTSTLKNPDEFWRPYGIPTLSAADSYYNPMGYWNGPVWIPWQYLVYRGLKDYGYLKEAKALGGRIAGNVIHQLKKDHYFWEFYSPDDHQAGWNKTYIWSGLLAEMLED